MNNELRERVFKRDKYICQYCGRKFAYTWRKYKHQVILECDHIIPARVGGTDTMDNLVACCSDCNRFKSSYPIDAKLLRDLKDVVIYLDAHEEHFINDKGFPVILRPKKPLTLGLDHDHIRSWYFEHPKLYKAAAESFRAR